MHTGFMQSLIQDRRNVGDTLCISLLAALFAGCTSILTPSLEKDFVPSSAQGVVFGAGQIVTDGKILAADDKDALLPLQIVAHLSPFTNVDELDRTYSHGTAAIRMYAYDKGYFAASLLPGRYYFVEFDYLNGLRREAVRTYLSGGGVVYRADHARSVITFDVVPGKTTYIGTQQHLFRDGASKWSLEIKDDFDQASAWLLSTYPNLEQSLNKQLAVILPLKSDLTGK
jgi:hypothetical protein